MNSTLIEEREKNIRNTPEEFRFIFDIPIYETKTKDPFYKKMIIIGVFNLPTSGENKVVRVYYTYKGNRKPYGRGPNNKNKVFLRTTNMALEYNEKTEKYEINSLKASVFTSLTETFQWLRFTKQKIPPGRKKQFLKELNQNIKKYPEYYI